MAVVMICGHIGRHLKKYNIFRIENASNGFLVYEYIVTDTKLFLYHVYEPRYGCC